MSALTSTLVTATVIGVLGLLGFNFGLILSSWSRVFSEKELGLKPRQQLKRNILHDDAFTDRPRPDTGLFYIYNDNNYIPDGCALGVTKSALSTASYFLTAAMSHPMRTDDPRRAELFVIPFDVLVSFNADQEAVNCTGTHSSRLAEVVQALEHSKWFRRYNGLDHFWLIPDGPLPAALMSVVSQMTIGRYETRFLYGRGEQQTYGFAVDGLSWHTTRENWGCTAIIPAAVKSSGTLGGLEPYNQWRERRIMLHYRGNGGQCVQTQERVAAVKLASEHVLPPGRVLLEEELVSDAELYSELEAAQFCLILPCSSGAASIRIFEAIATGCLPVIVDDAWLLTAAPFVSSVNYDAFVVHIPGDRWISDTAAAAHLAYAQPEGTLRRMVNALHDAQRTLLWNFPGSFAVDKTLSVALECTSGRNTQVV